MPAWTGTTISSAADIKRVLADVNQRGLTRVNTSALAEVASPADDIELRPDASKLLPADPQIAPLLPWPGLRRGATVSVVGSTSLLLMMLAGAMRDGAWAAVAGVPQLGVLAALQEHCIPGERLALVPDPGPDWPTIVAALMDGVDLVVVGVPAAADGTVRSLKARARERGCVLVPLAAWPGADLTLEVTGRRWEGLRQGSGRLKRQHLEVTAVGRGRAARPRTGQIVLGEPDVSLPPLPADLPPVAPLRLAKPEPPAVLDPWANPQRAGYVGSIDWKRR
jgi:hypothetical protein